MALKDESTKKEVVILSSAPPPWHSIAFILLGSIICVSSLPSWKSIDEVATVETFTKRIFPDSISLYQLACIRFSMAAFIWAVTAQLFFSDGWKQKMVYLDGSKLINGAPNRMSGIKTLFPFTNVSWNLLGISFTLSGYIAWQQAAGSTTSSSLEHDAAAPSAEISKFILRSALISWEMAAPFTFMVATVVRYALWPGILYQHGDTTVLKSTWAICTHNVNVVFALTEVALLGGLPVRWQDIWLGPAVGLVYIIFTWSVACRWNDSKKYGPQFIYFFLDTTLPGYFPSIVLVVLLMALMLFYAVFASAEHVLNLISPFGWLARVALIIALSSSMMRFRD